MADTDLYDQAEALLDACRTLLGVRTPEDSYLSPGLPAFNCCPQLTVHVQNASEAAIGPVAGLDAAHRYATARLNMIAYVVTILRCYDQPLNGSAPTAAQSATATAEVLADLWILWNGLNHLMNDGVLFRDCGERLFEASQAIDPQGACAGWLLFIRVSLPGYDPLA